MDFLLSIVKESITQRLLKFLKFLEFVGHLEVVVAVCKVHQPKVVLVGSNLAELLEQRQCLVVVTVKNLLVLGNLLLVSNLC